MHTGLNEHIADKYGGKPGMLNFLKYQSAYHLGLLSHFSQIDVSNVERLVFVCRGNICRSPYAEVVAKRYGVEARSFGLCTRGGAQANEAAIRNGAMRGIDLSHHRSLSVSEFVFQPGDLLIGMEPKQGHELKQLSVAANSVTQITLLGIWGARPIPYIQDPYGCGDSYFQSCFSLIEKSVVALLEQTGLGPKKCTPSI